MVIATLAYNCNPVNSRIDTKPLIINYSILIRDPIPIRFLRIIMVLKIGLILLAAVINLVQDL